MVAMATLGEAFIAVRADTRPFTRDLDKQLKEAADRFEKNLKKAFDNVTASGEKQGEKLGDETGEGFSRKFKKKTDNEAKSWFIRVPAALASALDDGISALPAEVKAAIVIGIVAAIPLFSPLLAAGITGVLVAGVGVLPVALGVLFASQFEEVETQFGDLAERLRVRFARAAEPVAHALLATFDRIEQRIESWGPLLNRIFSGSAGLVAPLTSGALNALEQILVSLDRNFPEIAKFVEELARGLGTLGGAFAEALTLLAQTGEEGRQGLRDIIFLISILIVHTAQWLAFLTETYGVMRDVAITLGPLAAGLSLFAGNSDAAAQSNVFLRDSNNQLAGSFASLIKVTNQQETELRQLKNALDQASNAAQNSVQDLLDYEAAIDNATEALKRNGNTLDVTDKKGRENAQALLNVLREAQGQTENLLKSQQITGAEAVRLYQAQVNEVRALASAAGVSDAEFQRLFGDMINVAQLQFDAAAMGLVSFEGTLSEAANEAKILLQRLEAIKRFRLPSQGTRGFSEFAEGGIVHGPTPAIVGEAGREVIIPLTKPGRAAQLAQQSGLDKLLGMGQAATVMVFIGDEQLDARMVRVVQANNNQLGRTFSFGPRG